MPDAELAGIVDRDGERARSIAGEYGCPVIESVAELAERVDAVSVAVPTEFHRTVAVELLEAGVDVLVEKPIARSLDEADAILHAAESGGRLVMTGHTERFNPAVVALAAEVDSPRFFEIHRLAAFSARSTDIDVVLDLMIHDLDLLLALDGSEPVAVDAVGVAALTDKVDIANARIRMRSGCVANLTASRISAEPLRRIRVFQARTYLSCDTGARKLERYQVTLDQAGAPSIAHERLEVGDQEPLYAELSAFVAGVRTRSAPSIDGRAGRAALALAYRVREAMQATAASSAEE
jgi:predicted dehydrogenase